MQPLLRSILTFLVVGFCIVASAGAQGKADEPSVLMKLDSEFDKATAEKGIDGWVAYFAKNGSMLSDTSKPTTGPDEIRKAMEPALKDPSYSLRWQPTKAEMMIPGVLGYTVGKYERKRRNREGKMMVQRGTYTSVWKKQPDGSWKIVLDTGSPDGLPVEVK